MKRIAILSHVGCMVNCFLFFVTEELQRCFLFRMGAMPSDLAVVGMAPKRLEKLALQSPCVKIDKPGREVEKRLS